MLEEDGLVLYHVVPLELVNSKQTPSKLTLDEEEALSLQIFCVLVALRWNGQQP